MAYLEKYYITYCTPEGLNCRASILQRDYVGAVTELTGQEIPFLINYESTEDFKFSPIRASAADVFMVFGGNLTDFEEFWTADEREFKVMHYVNSALEWSGFVIPNGFSYELRGGLYYASIQASDGLSTLQALDFMNDNTGKNYGQEDLTYNNGFEFPFILILTEILRKLDLEISVWTCIDSYEKTMTKTGDTRNADPLAVSYANVKTYINDTKRKDIPYWNDIAQNWNCEEVLMNLCYLFGAKVFQEKGVWKFKTINADVDYGTGITQRYWRKYNTLAVYLGYEPINSLNTVSCELMIENDHTMAMGDVYKAFRMNYEYQFVRDGDSPIQLLTNGNFEIFNNVAQYSAPFGWERYTSNASQFGLPRLRDITINDTSVPFTKGIEFGKQKAGLENTSYAKPANYYSALIHKDLIPVNKGDKLFFEVWHKHLPRTETFSPFYDVLYKLVITTTDGKKFYLGNNPSQTDMNAVQWSEIECHFRFFSGMMKSDFGNYEVYINKWRNFSVDLQIPENGDLLFQIKGLTASSGAWSNDSYKPLMTYMLIDGVAKLTRDQGKVIRGNWADDGGDIPLLQIGNVSLSKIPNPSDLASVQDFIYNNTNPYYSLVPEPITVFNGDLQDSFHISNIIVPTNVSGGRNFWDTIDNKFGNTSLGLLTVREIMSQYHKPFRILEGTVKGLDLNFSDVYEFDILPGLRFILQRGALNRKKGYVENATFMQLLTDTLPIGGTESGNNTDPNWQPTGRTRCRKNGFLNDGFVEMEEQDINSNSESFEEIRWIPAGYDNQVCPLDYPNGFYWKADVLGSTYLGFNTYPVIWNTPEYPDTAIVEYDNTGGLYLYFIHLDALGVVEEITTAVQSNIISDWQYLSDVTFNGYLYRVLRMNYITADFTGLLVRFKFSKTTGTVIEDPLA